MYCNLLHYILSHQWCKKSIISMSKCLILDCRLGNCGEGQRDDDSCLCNCCKPGYWQKTCNEGKLKTHLTQSRKGDMRSSFCSFLFAYSLSNSSVCRQKNRSFRRFVLSPYTHQIYKNDYYFFRLQLAASVLSMRSTYSNAIVLQYACFVAADAIHV